MVRRIQFMYGTEDSATFRKRCTENSRATHRHGALGSYRTMMQFVFRRLDNFSKEYEHTPPRKESKTEILPTESVTGLVFRRFVLKVIFNVIDTRLPIGYSQVHKRNLVSSKWAAAKKRSN